MTSILNRRFAALALTLLLALALTTSPALAIPQICITCNADYGYCESLCEGAVPFQQCIRECCYSFCPSVAPAGQRVGALMSGAPVGSWWMTAPILSSSSL